jgi:hypothetical protein
MKKSSEAIILTVVLVLLVATAAGLTFTFPSVQDITEVPSTLPTGHTPAVMKADDLQQQLTSWNSPTDWTLPENKHRLFISDGILFYPSLYPDGDYLKKFDSSTRAPSGVLISWYQKNRLDFTDPNIDREDPDGDGYSNIVEFRNDPVGVRQKAADCDGTKSTNPLDPKSHPDPLSRLRLQKYDSRPFHIQFRGYQSLDGVEYFQIYLKDVDSAQQPRLKKTGDTLGFEGYIIGSFHQNIVSKEDPATHISTPVDESTLEVDKPDIGLKVVLPFRQEIDSPESTADFVVLMPSERDKVINTPRGKTFSAPFTDNTYLVIDAKADGAIIQDVKTKQNINIPLLDPKEWDDVPVAK